MFLHPYILCLLLLPLLLAAYQIRKSSGQHRWSATGLRLLALSLVIVALARPFQRTTEATKHFVAVVDCSPSMDAAAMEQAAAGLKSLAAQAGPGKLRLVVFGSTAREVALDDAVRTADGLAKLRFSEPGSAVAEALDLAATLCPDDANAEVHLFSDGRETRGGMVSAAANLGRRGLELKIHELGMPAPSPVLLRLVRTPGAAAVGEAVTFTADIECLSAGEAKLTVTDDKGATLVSQTVQLRAGLQEVPFLVRPEQSGWQHYQVSLDSGDQTLTAGLKVSRTVVGVFETAPEAPATQALRDLLGTHAEIQPLTVADLAGSGMDDIDVIALTDTPAAELPVESQQRLRSWVENGGGLLVTGGHNAFGPGGYSRSELAAALPLRFPQKKEVRDPGTSLAIIIDTSGSMGASGVSLAQEVARLALKRLKPHDKAGIVEFHGAKRWAAPMQSAANSIALHRSLNRLSVGGGTVLMPALEEAYYGLQNVRTRTKHVLLLTDGGVEQGAFETIIRRMADDGIQVSTVLVGPRSASTFLSELAGWGRGQFYTAPSPFKIPEIIFKQPSSSLLDPFVEKETGLEPVLTSQLMQALELKDAPPLHGYVKTEAKDTTELLLRSAIGDPILARWHYGLGRVAILTTQLGGTWAEDFLSCPTAPNLIANLTRQLGGRLQRQPLSLNLDWSSAGLDLDLRALSSDPSLAAAPLRVEVKDANDALVATREIMPVRAQTWQTRIEDLPTGDFLIEVRDATKKKVLTSGALVVPATNEFNRAAPDRAKLTAAARTAGEFAAKVAAPKTPVLTRELWPLCAALGLLSFILMILVRRLPGVFITAPQASRSAAAVLALWVVILLSSPPASAADVPPRLDGLLKMRINRIIAMPPTEAPQEMKTQCQKILWQSGGDLTAICGYLRSLKEPKVKPLLAVALSANGDLKEAEELLSKLAEAPDAEAWVSAELAQVKQRIQEKLNQRDMVLATPLTPEEQDQINNIVGMKPDEARQALTLLCEQLNRRHGDLAMLCEHLRTIKDAPAALPLLALAATANGDLREADRILSILVVKPDADLWVITELARIKEMLGDGPGSLSLLDRALKMTSDPGLRFALRVRQAQLRYEANELEAARTALRSIANDPAVEGQEGRNYCARIAAMHGDDTLVTELFLPTGEGNERRRNLLFQGESLMRIGKAAEARKPFEAALALSTTERDRRYVLDRIIGAARAMNALPALIDTWLKSEALLPEQLEMMVGILGGELDRTADVLALMERRDLPEKTRKLIETPAFQERLAMMASDTGKSELARRAYLKLMERQPDDFTIRNSYVRLLLMEGDRSAAENVYQEVIASAKTASELMEVAIGARGMGLKEIAIQAASMAGGMGDAAHLQAQLFLAEVHHEQGDSGKTLDILRGLERRAEGDIDLLTQLAQAYEQKGLPNDAIRLYQTADPHENEKVLIKLIALMEAQGRNDEAFVLWRRLWETATEPMSVIQASDRLVEIGSKTGKLADLAIELEERLDQGKLREREESLLLDIYTSVSDPISAADILMEISSHQGGGNVATYKRLLRVYMECELFGRCNAVLHRLIALDPDNRDEYLQTLVLIALERKNNGDALLVLEQMAQRSKEGILRDSFSASVLKLINRHEDAAKVYRRTLAENPDEVETWLMWGTAIVEGDAKEREDAKKQQKRPPSPHDQAGNRKVCGTFSVMLENAEADDLFTIAIDGLLNAQAPPYAMQNGLRRLNERIAADPHNFLLYRLSADLNEELLRPRSIDRSLGQGLIVADDETSIVMRELIAIASSEKRTDDMIAFGRSLLNISLHLPPGECLELGSMLLDRGYSNEAEIAFQRVISDSTALATARGVVELYENVGLFSKAGKIIRNLLIENAFDVDLLLRLGLVEEKKGDFVAAAKAYGQAIQLMLGRVPSLTKKTGEKLDGRLINVDDITLYLAPVVRGLIASTRTPESRQRLLDDLGQRFRNELDNLKASDAFAATADENPRLNHLSKLMRQLCFVFHELGHGEAMDDELLRHYSKDQKLRASIVEERNRWRTFQSADELLIRNRLDDQSFRVVKSFLGGRKAVEKLLASKDLSAAEQTEAFTFLAMHGYDDLIDQLKAGCDLNQTPENDGETLLTVGLAAKRPDLVRDALFANLNRMRQTLDALGKGTRERLRESLRPAALFNQIVAAWPVLSEQDRSTAVNLYGMLIEETDYIDPLRCSYHFLLTQAGRANEVPFDAVAHYPDSPFYSFILHHSSAIVDGWIGQQAAAERPAAVRRLLGARQGKERAELLTKLSGFLSDATLTDELRTEFPELAAGREQDDAPAIASDEADRMMAGKRAELQQTIATARERMGSDVGMVLTLHELTLRTAASMLPPAELDILLKDLKISRDPFEKLIAFLLLIHAGRDSEAMAQLQVIAALHSDDAATEAVRAAMPIILNAYGWHTQALHFLPEGSAAPAGNLEMYFRLHDPLAILQGKDGNRLAASKRRIHAAKLMASPGQHLQASRIYFADTRHPDIVKDFSLWYSTRTWPNRVSTTPGGLVGFKEKTSGTILDDLGDLSDGQDELHHWLQAMETKRAHDDEICAAIAGSVSKHGLSPQLRRDWQAAAERSLLNRLDIDLISAIAVQSPEQLPNELANQMKFFILNDRRRNSEHTMALAEACKAFGQADLARSLGRWSVTMDLLATGSSSHLPTYLASFPEAERKIMLTELVPHMGPSSLRVMTGDGLGPMLAALLDQDMTAEAATIVDHYLRFRPFKPHSFLSDSAAYKAMFSGFGADSNAQDDAVASALARLKRPQPYERLLRLKARETRLNISPLYRTSYVDAATPTDHTDTLPEPGEVDDINRYIDIHLNVAVQLRQEGSLSPVNHVAWICTLGEWCAKRGLNDRASALLKQAEELSAGMFTGRLWVADLHRLLGNKIAAEQIEQELLDLDLLPMPRVPAVLEVLAATKGRAAADAVAFRVAGYSNHPQVLPQALRHARANDMKKEQDDIAERLRKVSTLFLPPGEQASQK